MTFSEQVRQSLFSSLKDVAGLVDIRVPHYPDNYNYRHIGTTLVFDSLSDETLNHLRMVLPSTIQGANVAYLCRETDIAKGRKLTIRFPASRFSNQERQTKKCPLCGGGKKAITVDNAPKKEN